MGRFYVLCALYKGSSVKTSLPVIAKDQKAAVKIARGAGLVPYGVVFGKRIS